MRLYLSATVVPPVLIPCSIFIASGYMPVCPLVIPVPINFPLRFVNVYGPPSLLVSFNLVVPVALVVAVIRVHYCHPGITGICVTTNNIGSLPFASGLVNYTMEVCSQI